MVYLLEYTPFRIRFTIIRFAIINLIGVLQEYPRLIFLASYQSEKATGSPWSCQGFYYRNAQWYWEAMEKILDTQELVSSIQTTYQPT